MSAEITIAAPHADVKDEWIAMWPDYLSGARPLPSTKELNITFARLQDPDNQPCGLFAYDETKNKLVGFCHFVVHATTKTSQMRCYLEDAYVLPEYRRQGIFKKLYAALLEESKKQNWERIFWITAPKNRDAQSFYDQIATRTDWIRYEYEVENQS